MKYKILDAGSNVIQWGNDDTIAQAGQLPAGAVAITDTEWAQRLSTPFQPTLAAARISAKATIDTIAGAIRKKYAADWLVDKEYDLALTDANAYKAAGYTGAVPATVQSWATASGNTATWSADNIIATAAALNAKLVSIRTARLNGKAAVDAATTQAGIDSAVATATTNLNAL